MLSQEFQHLPCQNCNIQLNPPPCLCTFKNVIAEQASPKPDVKDINRNKLSKAERERERETYTDWETLINWQTEKDKEKRTQDWERSDTYAENDKKPTPSTRFQPSNSGYILNM